jgi:hypothetical protein
MRCRLRKPVRENFEQPQFTADAVATLAGWNRDALLEMAERARGGYP